MSAPTGEHPANESYWTLIRDVGVLQVKLLVDGLRDLVLVPASLVAGVVSLVNGRNGKPGAEFYQLLAVGKRSERWINLFGALRHAPVSAAAEPASATDIDDLVAKVETFVVQEYRRGGVTKQAKDRIDEALAAIERRRKPRR